MVDRKLLKNPNGLILGTPGSGKSFSAKREIANCFLLTSDDVIICDPEAEYAPLVERLHGQVIKISPTSANYINPMDLNLDYSDDESPLSLKSDFILSLCELIVGGKDGLQPVQKTIIDRCVRLVYQTYLNDPRPENMPILEDLYSLLREQEEKEAQYIATALEIYVAAAVYLYQADNDGEWGELRFDFENGTAEIVRLADWDTVKSNIFAKTAIRFVQRLPEARLLKSVVVPFEMGISEKPALPASTAKATKINPAHTISLRQTECRKTGETITAAVYQYLVDNDGEWGELRFDFENGTAEIVKLADWDTVKSNVFAKAAIQYVRYLLRQASTKQVIVLYVK